MAHSSKHKTSILIFYVCCIFASVLCILSCAANPLVPSTGQLGSSENEPNAQSEDDPDHPTVDLATLKTLSADDTVAWAKAIAELTTTRMGDYAPFTDNLSALLDDAVNVRADLIAGAANGQDAVMPIMATSAFYPYTATLVEAYYTRDAYEASTTPLEPVATGEAFKALAAGQDIVYISSRPNDEQIAMLEASGLDIRCEPIAYEALIFYSRDESRQDGTYPTLSSDDIRACFTSAEPRYTGFALEHGNGSTRCFEEFLSGQSASLDVSGSVMMYPDMNSIIAGAALTDGSIGYAFHQFYHRNCSSCLLDLVAVDGIYPSWENIRSGAYPVMCEVCVLYNAGGSYADEASAFIDWARTADGKQVSLDVGLCPYG